MPGLDIFGPYDNIIFQSSMQIGNMIWIKLNSTLASQKRKKKEKAFAYTIYVVEGSDIHLELWELDGLGK